MNRILVERGGHVAASGLQVTGPEPKAYQRLKCATKQPSIACPESARHAGGDVQIYFNPAGHAVRFMGASRTDILKK